MSWLASVSRIWVSLRAIGRHTVTPPEPSSTSSRCQRAQLSMNTIREIQKINDRELELGIAGTSGSWHEKYAKCAWVHVGNMDYTLTEGDVICVMSQFGEVEDLHLVRDDATGKSKGFAFCKYEDARSCVLAVDNLCGSQICGRLIRVDHVENYRLPKQLQENEEQAAPDVSKPGLAYQGKDLASSYTLTRGQDLFAKGQVEMDAQEEGPQSGNGRTSENGSDESFDDSVRRKQRKHDKSRRKRDRGKKARKGKNDTKDEKSRKKKRRRRDSSEES